MPGVASARANLAEAAMQDGAVTGPVRWLTRGSSTDWARGLLTVALPGRDGGKAKALADHALVVPSMSTARIE